MRQLGSKPEQFHPLCKFALEVLMNVFWLATRVWLMTLLELVLLAVLMGLFGIDGAPLFWTVMAVVFTFWNVLNELKK